MRLAMYVDGWNFYWSLVNAGLKPYGWCDFPLLARQQACAPEAEVHVKYFTSADKPHAEKINDRQKPTWWRALGLIGCEVLEGEFRSTREEAEEQNRFTSKNWREKQTDVKLAIHMLGDASRITPDPELEGGFRWSPGYDRAVLLTQDTDFIPLVQAVSREPLRRSILVLLPPSDAEARENACRAWVQGAAGLRVTIKQLEKTDLAKALLPKEIRGDSGEIVKCHSSWMWREKHLLEVARAADTAKRAMRRTGSSGVRQPGK